MMLLKQQYEQALSRVITDNYYFTKDIYDKDKASVFDEDVDMLEQLIETHFEIVEKLCKYFNCKSEYSHFLWSGYARFVDNVYVVRLI